MGGVSLNASVSGRLKKSAIDRALIIDDAYDQPTAESVQDHAAGFWARIAADDVLIGELTSIIAGIAQDDVLTDAHVGLLWNQRDKLPRLGGVLNETLFLTKLGDRDVLRKLEDFLKEVGVTPITLGVTAATDNAASAPLVFLDYYLGPVNEESVGVSRERAQELYQGRKDQGDPPFIVLMSSKLPAGSGGADLFRRASGLLGGLFGFLTKQDFDNKAQLYFHFASWAFGMPARHQIYRFVDAVEKALPKVRDDFLEHVQALGVEDYANIQWLCLHDEGQPLPDQVSAVPFREVETWLQAGDWKRKHRLTLPFALQVQQAFAANAVRIGTPVRPPVYQRVAVAVYGMGTDGSYQEFGDTIGDGAVLIRRYETKPDEVTFVLTLQCILEALSRLDGVEESCLQRKRNFEAQLVQTAEDSFDYKRIGAAIHNVNKRVSKVAELRNMSGVWESALRRPVDLPDESKHRNIDNLDLIYVCRRELSGEYKELGPIFLRLRLDALRQ